MPARPFVSVAACFILPALAPVWAQQLKLPSFADLQRAAIDSVNITIDSSLLGMMGSFMTDHDADSADLKKAVAGLKSVQIHSYRFKSDFPYMKSEIDAIRSQLSGPGWRQMVQVHDQGKGENVDIYYALENRTVTGLAILACAPRGFTVVNIVGTVDLDQVARLRKTFVPAERGSDSASLSPR